MLKKFPEYRFLVPLALLLGLLPFYPKPHLIQKLEMLQAGTLRRPLDIFDLVWHSWPLALLGFRVGRDLGRLLRHDRRQ